LSTDGAQTQQNTGNIIQFFRAKDTCNIVIFNKMGACRLTGTTFKNCFDQLWISL